MATQPTPEQLACEPSARALLGALRELGGEASPAQLAELTGLAPQTRAKWLGRLREAGLVAGPKPRPHLTQEGRAAAGVAVTRPASSLELDAAIAYWPTPQQRATLRLIFSAVAARWHLAGEREQRHPGFILAGGTGTGKTALTEFVCRALGVDVAAQVVLLPGRTAGEILGRREREEGGTMRLAPSPLLSQPLLVFDEFDKADAALQRDALLCFQGGTRAVIEQTTIEQRAVPLLTCNKREKLPVHEAYLRRSVVLDTDPLRPVLGTLPARLRDLYDAGGPPALDLSRLAPPVSRLDRDAFALLTELLHRGLTEDGLRLCTLESIELLALGRAGGTPPGEPLTLYVVDTVLDYLTCAETVGETREEWRTLVAGATGHSSAEVRASLHAGAEQRRQLQAAEGDRHATRQREDLELIGARSEFAEQLRLARPDGRRLPAAVRPAAAATRDQLDNLRARVKASRSADALEELRELARPALAQAAQLHARAAAEREQEAAAKRDTDRRARDQKDQAAAAAAATRQSKSASARARSQQTERRRQERKTATDMLTAVRRQARALEALRRPGRRGNPLAELQTASAFGRPLLTFHADTTALGAARWERLLGALAGASGMGEWISPFDPAVRFSGTRQACDALAAWGPPARLALDAALRELHAHEDELQHQAAGKPRAARPVLTSSGTGIRPHDQAPHQLQRQPR